MDMATAAVIENLETKPQAQPRPETKTAKKRVPTRPGASKYNVRATVVRRTITVGDPSLARQLERTWDQLHFGLYYVTVFAPAGIGGRLVTETNKAITKYIDELLSEAEGKLQRTTHLLHEEAITLGAPGDPFQQEVEVSSPIEQAVLRFVRTSDDYLVVMDSLWIGEIIDRKERDEAREEVRNGLSSLHRLVTRARDRLIEYRRKSASGDAQASTIAAGLEAMMKSMTGIDIAQPSIPAEPAPPAQEARQENAAPTSRPKKKDSQTTAQTVVEEAVVEEAVA
jgi:hypothetical protein